MIGKARIAHLKCHNNILLHILHACRPTSHNEVTHLKLFLNISNELNKIRPIELVSTNVSILFNKSREICQICF